jgi:spore maturation protein CgeB
VRKVAGGPLEVHRRAHARFLISLVHWERPDIVIVLKGLHLGPDDVRSVRRAGAWVVNVNHDDFFSANPHNWSEHQRRAIPEYDYVFTTREVNVAEVAPANPRVEFIPFAYYPRIHRVVQPARDERPQWEQDVVFVGTWERERCELLEHLVTRVPARYVIWGGLWDRVSRRSPLWRYVAGSEAKLDAMAKALGCARVALAFLRKNNRDEYTQRTFEIPACGGVLVAERTPMHLRLYREGAEAEFFDANDPQELCAKVRRLLSDEVHRERIRVAGRAALLRQDHTYEDRLKRLLQLHAERTRPARGVR